MKKKLIKIIALLLFSLIGIFVFGQVDAVFIRSWSAWSDNGGMEVIGLEYDENDVLVMTFTFHEYEDAMDGDIITRGGIVFDQNNDGRILGIRQNQQTYPNEGVSYMQLRDPIIYAGDCITGGVDWWDYSWDYNATGQYSGFWVDSGNYCSICFESPNGGCLTKDEIGDPPFYENYSLPYYLHARIGEAYEYSDGHWYDGSGIYNSEPVYDLIPWGETPVPIDGECGIANGGHFSTRPDVSTLCSAESYVFLPSYVETPAGWTWICGGYNGGTQAYCSADFDYDLDPTIDDVIDFDWDDFDYDFEEEDVSKNWLIDVFKFLFLPREETLQKFFTAFDDFKQKIPFGYIYLIQNKFKEVSLESTDEFALDLNLLGEEYEVFSVTSLKEKIGENTFNIFYNTMKALIWIVFALYLITKVQKLFNNND
jgi:hypothetical protein